MCDDRLRLKRVLRNRSTGHKALKKKEDISDNAWRIKPLQEWEWEQPEISAMRKSNICEKIHFEKKISLPHKNKDS